MGEHSSLSLLHKLVGIISFLFLWHARMGPFIGAGPSLNDICSPGSSDSKCLGYNMSIPCSPNQWLPCEEANALQNVLDALGSQLESDINITGSYCNDKSKPIKCNCSYTGNLCHITEINLNGNSISGYIHEDVSDLESLVTLDLSSNRLSGTIPDSLGTLSNLATLNLNHNQLTGSIPKNLGNLKNLTSLGLRDNQLSGTIPYSLGNLSSLTYLDLGYNQLTGRIPGNLKNLRSLTSLDLSSNFLTGKIPPSLGELSSLEVLFLRYNKLEGHIPDELGNLSKLVFLSSDENLLYGPLPTTLGRLSNLQYLSLTSNNFTGELPPSFFQLTSLLEFGVAGNSLTNPIPSYIKNWVNLTKLDLLGNNFEGPLPPEILNMSNLRYLSVSDLISNTSFSLPENANWTISSLILRNCSVTGPIPSNFGFWSWLLYLDLSFNNLTGGIPLALKNASINDMYLTGNMLSGVAPGWINDKVQDEADLSYNNFANVTFPEAKRNHKNLALNSMDVTSQKIKIAPNRNSIRNMSNDYCQDGKSKYHSLFINSGGEEANINGTGYEADENLSSFYVSDKSNWAYTCSGGSVSSSYSSSDYIKNLTCGVSVPDEALYKKARLCPVSLTYYGFCLHKGSYTVKLHFAEVVYTENADYSSLGKRVFDVYVQGKIVLKNFNIKEEAGGPNKACVVNFTAHVQNDDNNVLKIHFFWAGKGSTALNGPLISAISVTPNFKVSGGGLSTWHIAGITVASILAPLLLLALLWIMGLVGDRELRESRVQIQGKDYTIKQIIDATRKFSRKMEIGRGRFGIVYKAELPGQVVVAVKTLYPKLMQQEGDEIRNEIFTLKSLEHENLVQLLDGYSKKDLHFLIYEYMEHGSLEQALFGPSPLALNWDARFKICKGIAKGLKYLHEETRFNIIHGDIKTTNILLDGTVSLDGTPTPTAKLSDFGLAKFHEEENPFLVIKARRTLTYMAPEYALKKPITVKVDVYSFGVVLLELVSGKPNAEYRDNQETVFLLDKASDLHAKGRPLELVDRKLSNEYDRKEAITVLNLAMMCINQFPDRRPKMSEIVSVLEGEKTIEQISAVATP